MKSATRQASDTPFWQPPLNSVVLIATTVAIVMTASICSAAPQIGVGCALPFEHGSNILQQCSSNQITIPLGQNGAGFAPPICGAGLDLGGFVQCTNPGVLSIRSANTFTVSRDYLAITSPS